MGGGESAPRALFTDIEAHISSMYKATLKQRTSIGASTANILHWDRLSPEREHKAISYHIDSKTVIYDLELPPPRPNPPLSKITTIRILCPCPAVTMGEAKSFRQPPSCASVRSRCRRLPVHFQTLGY